MPCQHPAPHYSHALPKQAGPEPHCYRCGCYVVRRPARKRRAADCAKSTAQSWRAACFSSAARARNYCSNNDDVIDQQVCSSCADRQADRQFGRKTHTASSKAAARLISDATGRSRCRTLLPCPPQRLPHGTSRATVDSQTRGARQGRSFPASRRYTLTTVGLCAHRACVECCRLRSTTAAVCSRSVVKIV